MIGKTLSHRRNAWSKIITLLIVNLNFMSIIKVDFMMSKYKSKSLIKWQNYYVPILFVNTISFEKNKGFFTKF